MGLAFYKVTTKLSKRHQESFCNTINNIRFGDRNLKQTPLFIFMRSVLLLLRVRQNWISVQIYRSCVRHMTVLAARQSSWVILWISYDSRRGSMFNTMISVVIHSCLVTEYSSHFRLDTSSWDPSARTHHSHVITLKGTLCCLDLKKIAWICYKCLSLNYQGFTILSNLSNKSFM